jgi:hypothetical protein
MSVVTWVMAPEFRNQAVTCEGGCAELVDGRKTMKMGVRTSSVIKAWWYWGDVPIYLISNRW